MKLREDAGIEAIGSRSRRDPGTTGRVEGFGSAVELWMPGSQILRASGSERTSQHSRHSFFG